MEQKALTKALADLNTEVAEQQKFAAANPDAPSGKLVTALSVSFFYTRVYVFCFFVFFST